MGTVTGQAWGSCGDWLDDSAGEMEHHAGEIGGNTSEFPSPCHSPHCRQAPLAPAAPVQETVELRQTDQFDRVLNDFANRCCFGGQSLLSLMDEVPVAGFPMMLDRPPRQTA